MRQKDSDFQVDPRRLQDLESLCAVRNIHLVLVIPPTDQPADSKAVPQVLAAATATGVTALLPVESSSLDHSYYSDGLHLNAKGARLFTSALAEALRESIQSTLVAANGKAQPPETHSR